MCNTAKNQNVLNSQLYVTRITNGRLLSGEDIAMSDRCSWFVVEAPPHHTGQGDNKAPVAVPLVSPPTVYNPGYQFNTFVIWPKQTHSTLYAMKAHGGVEV